jgi:hypothetical protein
VRPTSTAKGVTPGKIPGHNDEGIDEKGTESGSIPDARIVLYLVMAEKVRSIRTPAVLSRCGVYKRTAAPVDAKTGNRLEQQQLVANTKTERREVSRLAIWCHNIHSR